RGILYLVVAEGEAQAARVLPAAAGLVGDVVRILAGAVVPDRCAPAVVDDAVGHGSAVAGEQRLEGAVLLGRIRPVDVVPEHGGAVSLDQVVHVRSRVGGVVGADRSPVLQVGVGGDRRVVGERPVQPAGIVDAEA